MDARELARALVGEVLDGVLDEAKKKYSKPNMHPQYGRPEKVKGWKRARAGED